MEGSFELQGDEKEKGMSRFKLNKERRSRNQKVITKITHLLKYNSINT